MMLPIEPYTPPEMIFMIGLPGAGKSTWVNHYLDGFRQIDADIIKTRHPAYDPHNPSTIHTWSKRVADYQFHCAISQAIGSWVISTTGSNFGSMLDQIQLGKDVGFLVGLVYIKCSLTTALSRNINRERIIPEYVILQKAQTIPSNFTLLAPLVDYTIEVDNEADNGSLTRCDNIMTINRYSKKVERGITELLNRCDGAARADM